VPQSAAACWSACICPWRAPQGRGERFCAERLHPDRPLGKITLIMPQVEMGQGVYTAIAMILAEELTPRSTR